MSIKKLYKKYRKYKHKSEVVYHKLKKFYYLPELQQNREFRLFVINFKLRHYPKIKKKRMLLTLGILIVITRCLGIFIAINVLKLLKEMIL